ncbi:hypothetical protein AtNW77_Chr3g0190531 [Arabidopsis thaliana]|uniref:Transmembrane protein n=5 Tax=Arabidopsis TaxID=3701 RepID=A0A384LM77_ARATH|nr:uncharacterized protein AT3G29300 [Arabidopsis thaliana]KAG7627026.1 hypothetical protein ISN45_At03g031410 [Arabidopsis thaliana x Arabidopsis arenosa]KAG7633002.1 hypothetical protein ISN44_As03g030980 [Arabidopsis suecica]ANM65846.1 transmembrane protein [Arabidopsis thaliana]OAP06385.1 hypothetical protein AXX17_AT3G32210 [Arabidopsis thaliana]CAA0384097.1 unnamed protein product [Arabidopsis thaliana]|eukprot:NP_001327785.1 transmembrane protein [Arabidopsis thaliana]
MNSSSKVIMAATLVMVVSLVMVLSLVLVLLAELYCSLLLRRRRHNSLNLPITTTVSTAARTTTTLNQAISTTSNDNTSPSNINSSSPNPLYTGVIQTPTKTHYNHEPYLQASLDLIQETIVNDSVDNFIYISNPMYSNDATSKPTTPFETPESSPSRLETGESSSSSSGEEDNDHIIEVSTPTLTPMKDLPEKACSVSLKNVETSASESNSSGSPYTSPSW